MSTKSKEMSDYPEMDYFMDESVSDIVFVIEEQRLPAEKRFLSVKNRVFRAMFSDNFKESKDKEVVIKDTTFDAFKTLIQFLYTEQLVLKNGNDFKLMDEIYKLSDRYESFRLFNKMAKHMKTIPITDENIELISRIAERSENKGLIKHLLAFIEKNLNNFITKDDKQYIELNDSTHNHLLKELVIKLKYYKRGICKECDDYFTSNATYPRCYDCKKQL